MSVALICACIVAVAYVSYQYGYAVGMVKGFHDAQDDFRVDEVA